MRTKKEYQSKQDPLLVKDIIRRNVAIATVSREESSFSGLKCSLPEKRQKVQGSISPCRGGIWVLKRRIKKHARLRRADGHELVVSYLSDPLIQDPYHLYLCWR